MTPLSERFAVVASDRRSSIKKPFLILMFLAVTGLLATDLPVRRWLVAAPPPPPPMPLAETPTPAPAQIAGPAPVAPVVVVTAPVEELAAPDPARTSLIDQIGIVQAQLMLARLQRELAQTQADIARLNGEERPAPVQALLDREPATSDPRVAARPSRAAAGAIAVQAVFGRDGNFAARLSFGDDGGSIVQVGDQVRAYRVAGIAADAVTLAPLQGGANLVLRTGARGIVP